MQRLVVVQKHLFLLTTELPNARQAQGCTEEKKKKEILAILVVTCAHVCKIWPMRCKAKLLCSFWDISFKRKNLLFLYLFLACWNSDEMSKLKQPFYDHEAEVRC